ncbi:MAG: CoA ester lyase [Pigmentiphaga sp.]
MSSTQTQPHAVPPPTLAARSVLFVPANRLDRVDKALAAGADHVVVDLEDAVEPQAKAAARAELATFLAARAGARLLVRVNAAGTDWHADDVAVCTQLDAVAGIMVPKAEDAGLLAPVALCRPVWAIVESARGLLALRELARVPGLARFMLGTLDLGVDLGLAPDSAAAETLLDQARYQVLVHSRAAGLAAPIDGVYPRLDDADGLRQHVARARDMGFGGVGCIHPAQVAMTHDVFQPGAAELDWARRVLAEAERTGLGAFRLDGAMVDAPVLARARTLLARAGSLAS